MIDKPVGLGSTQAVSAVKRILRQAGFPKSRVGHGGTLDPLASGVLPIAVGEATKLSGRMLDADKAYDFTLHFGEETSTLDAEGEVVARSERRPSVAEVATVLPRFTGPIAQRPPAYSALKVGGKRAYDLARAGEEVVLAERNITIHSLAIADQCSRADTPSRHPGEGRDPDAQPHGRDATVALLDSGLRRNDGDGLQTITLSARVSKGTYIRSLARDIAYALGTVGHVTMLHRTKAGPFTLPQAITLDNLEEAAKAGAVQALLLPLTAGLDDIPALPVSPDQALALRQGRRLDGSAAPAGLHLAVEGAMPVALVEVADDIRVVRGFNLMSE